MKKEEQEQWTQEELDEALVKMKLALADNYHKKDKYTLRRTLRGANLSGLNLEGAYLAHADLSDAVLTDAVLVNVELKFADLWGANLKGANLKYTTLYHATISFGGLDDVKNREYVTNYDSIIWA